MNLIQSQDYFLRRDNINDSLIVTQYRWYKDLISNKRCKIKELTYWPFTSDIWIQCLLELKKNWCEYIVAWYNNDLVAIQSKLNKIVTIKWTRFWVWYTYRAKKVDNYLIWNIDWYVTRYLWYSVMPWRVLYNLICEANKNWYIKEKELKKQYRTRNKISHWELDSKWNIILKNLKRYSKRVKEIWDKDERNEADDNELTMYRQKFNIMNAIAISDIFESWSEIEIKKIIELVKNSKNYYEVINNYMPN